MKSLKENYVINGQDPKLVLKAGKLEFHEKFGCLVYTPPGCMQNNREIESDGNE